MSEREFLHTLNNHVAMLLDNIELLNSELPNNRRVDIMSKILDETIKLIRSREHELKGE